MDLQLQCPCIVLGNNQLLKTPPLIERIQKQEKKIKGSGGGGCDVVELTVMLLCCVLFCVSIIQVVLSCMSFLWPYACDLPTPPPPASVVMTLPPPSDLDVNKPSTVEQSVFGPPLYKPVNTNSYACWKPSNSFRYFYNPEILIWHVLGKKKNHLKK